MKWEIKYRIFVILLSFLLCGWLMSFTYSTIMKEHRLQDLESRVVILEQAVTPCDQKEEQLKQMLQRGSRIIERLEERAYDD